MKALLRSKLIWVAALGYFVDLFDLVIYGAVRIESLKSLGYSGDSLFTIGTQLLNFQMVGMLLGGLTWGHIGDRYGRKAALFGSILIYSSATFANAWVNDYSSYAWVRLIAGFGLAGELGAAITLVIEVLPKNIRGLGSAFIASVGFLGAALASSISQHLQWRHAYLLGAGLGFALLIARASTSESLLYLDSKKQNQKKQWGSLGLLFSSSIRTRHFLFALLAGVPIWYVAGILSYFAPEFAKELEVTGPVLAGTTIMMGYLGAILGDIACGMLSQLLKSRKKAVLSFMIFGGLVASLHPLWSQYSTPEQFYLGRFLIGFGNGFFAILIAWIAEIFGTNLRATATIVVSNFIRASLIPITFAFQALKPHYSLNTSSMIIGLVCFGVAVICASRLPETFHRELNTLET